MLLYRCRRRSSSSDNRGTPEKQPAAADRAGPEGMKRARQSIHAPTRIIANSVRPPPDCTAIMPVELALHCYPCVQRGASVIADSAAREQLGDCTKIAQRRGVGGR